MYSVYMRFGVLNGSIYFIFAKRYRKTEAASGIVEAVLNAQAFEGAPYDVQAQACAAFAAVAAEGPRVERLCQFSQFFVGDGRGAVVRNGQLEGGGLGKHSRNDGRGLSG